MGVASALEAEALERIVDAEAGATQLRHEPHDARVVLLDDALEVQEVDPLSEVLPDLRSGHDVRLIEVVWHGADLVPLLDGTVALHRLVGVGEVRECLVVVAKVVAEVAFCKTIPDLHLCFLGRTLRCDTLIGIHVHFVTP